MLRVLLAVLAGSGTVTVLPKQDRGSPEANLETLLLARSDYDAMHRSLETVDTSADPKDMDRLSSEDPFCRAKALKALVPFFDRPEVKPKWLDTLRAARGNDRWVFAHYLEKSNAALLVFEEWLDVEDWTVLVKILPAFAEPPASAHVQARLRELAANHWSREVRDAAVRTGAGLGLTLEAAPDRPTPNL